MPVKGASAYPGVIITTCTSHLGTVERVTCLLSHSTTFVPVIHSLTERSCEGQPAHTASGEDGTTGKDRLAKTPKARSVVGLRRGSIGGKGTRTVEEPGKARSFDGNGGLPKRLEKANVHKGKCMNSWKKRLGNRVIGMEKSKFNEQIESTVQQTALPTREDASEVEQSQFISLQVLKEMLGWATLNGVSRMRGDPHVRFLGGSGRKTGRRPPD